MRYLIPATLALSALLISGCTVALPDTVKTGELTENQKDVITAWYDASGLSARERIEELSEKEIADQVTTFAALCSIEEDERARQLTSGPDKINANDAKKLAESIEENLCAADPDHKHTKKPSNTPTPTHTGPSKKADSSAKLTPQRAKGSTVAVAPNPHHDLDKPAAPQDREVSIEAPPHGAPTWTHSETKPNKVPQPRAAAPARLH